MSHVEYDADDATEIDGPPVAQKKWLDSIETIPFDPSMRVGSDLGEGTPPRAVAPVRVPVRADATPRPARRAQGTPRPAPRTPPRAPARHPHDNAITRLAHVDVAGGHVSYTPDPEQRALPLAAPIPTPLPGLYGAPALPPHVPTARALPPHAVMPTQIAQHVPAQAQHPALGRSFADGVTPYPVPPWATGQHAIPQPPFAHPHVAQSAMQPRYTVPQDHLDIYADTEERCGDERRGETMRVGALPPAMPVSLRPSLGRYLLPMIGGAALLVFVAGYFLVRGDSTSPAAPVASAAAPVVAPVKTAPVVSEIVEPQLPDPSWKHREAQPTIVATSEVISAPASVSADIEIEMAPMKAAPAKTKKSSARRAKRVAIVEKAPVKAAPIAAKPTKKPATVVAKSAKSDRDPILEEIEKPTKGAQAKATGPGKLVISSSVPTLIYIDGRSTNLMTPKTMNLTAGTHKITLLELKSRKAKTVDIDITSGTISKLDKKF